MTKKLTYEEVSKYINEQSCVLINTEYSNNREKLTIKCKCGNIFITTFNHFRDQNKQRCNNCTKFKLQEKTRKEHAQFVKEIYDLVGNEYVLESDYELSNKHILMKHVNCGNIYKVKPNNFLNGHRCSYCFSTPKKTHNSYLKEVENLNKGTEYEILETYINRKTPILTKHKICGYEWKASPSTILNGPHCPKCSKATASDNLRRSQEEAELIINKAGYILMSTYETSAKKVIVQCPKGHIVEMKFIHFLNGHRCKICMGTVPLEYKYVKEYIEGKSNTGYRLLSESYKNNSQKLKIQCDKNHVYYTSFGNFKNGKRCPKCIQSKGELQISKLLTDLKINFKTQFRIKECKNIRRLPFDFVVFSRSQDINMLIEYDGEQHYRPIFGEKAFMNTRNNDEIKNEFCNNNNIPLLRIPYWKFEDIEEILKHELVKFNLVTVTHV
ncbi:Protein of unknown function [Paenibacillus sophorae]|uniref:DUF2726 domain-containing protein n=1 Tax=Paenibacillus sophorae TaxID=1333845 RepID=A0A1H8H0B1_9BACL|nr:DUF2726 domain-containing protein [Paenibacillus sophorae]QWU14395.1 DUF2726 domain-containing protein [Paenibacillus sophorae]SEN49470.1 Protein of unknown function [Paenibacillus sophorae]